MSGRDYRDAYPTRAEAGLGLRWLLFVVAAIAVLTVVGWGMGWLAVPFQVTSAENVREQWRFAYQFEESLTATARQVCSAEGILKSAEDANERTQRRSQLVAFQQNYARIEAQYDARLRNAFEAKLVRPSDVPDRAPTLEETRAKVCK